MLHNFMQARAWNPLRWPLLLSQMVRIRYDFAYMGEKPASGGTGTISVNGKKVAEGQIGNTTPFLFSADETADVGMDVATPVTEDYAEGDNSANR